MYPRQKTCIYVCSKTSFEQLSHTRSKQNSIKWGGQNIFVLYSSFSILFLLFWHTILYEKSNFIKSCFRALPTITNQQCYTATTHRLVICTGVIVNISELPALFPQNLPHGHHHLYLWHWTLFLLSRSSVAREDRLWLVFFQHKQFWFPLHHTSFSEAIVNNQFQTFASEYVSYDSCKSEIKIRMKTAIIDWTTILWWTVFVKQHLDYWVVDACTKLGGYKRGTITGVF